MQSYETRLQPYVHKMPFAFMKASTFKNKIFVPIQCSAIKKGVREKYRPTLTLVSAKNELPSLFSQEVLQSKKALTGNPQSQAEHCIALIEDPLWKQVCTEFLAMMGPLSVLKIWNSRLGAISPRYKTIHIDCKTEEESEFIQKYSFVILGSLQAYFPAVKSLIVRVKR